MFHKQKRRFVFDILSQIIRVGLVTAVKVLS